MKPINIISKLNESVDVINDYEAKIKSAKDKEEVKSIVHEIFKDDKNVADVDLSDMVYGTVIPKLKEFGIDIPSYNYDTDESGYEVVMKEKY